MDLKRPDHPKFRMGADGTLWLNFGAHGQEVEVASISGDGRRILTVQQVGKARIWDSESGTLVGTVCPDSPLAGTTGSYPTAEPFKVFIESAALNKDGSLALLGLNDTTAGVFRVADGVRLAVLHPPGEKPAAEWGVIRAVAYSADFSLALVGFEGRRVGVWSEDGRHPVAFLAAPSGRRLVREPFVRDTLVSSVATSSDGKSLFVGCADMSFAIWDLDSKRLVLEALEHAEETLALFDDESGFGWATSAGSIWCCSGTSAPRKVLATSEQWSEVAFGKNALLARNLSGAVSHWTFSGIRSPQFEPSGELNSRWSHRATGLGFHGLERWHFPEGGDRLVVCSESRRVALATDRQIVSARFSPTGDTIGVGGWSHSVDLWSTQDGRLIKSFATSSHVGAFAFSPDGRLIAIGELGSGGGLYSRKVLVYEVESGELVHRLEGHQWQVSEVAFSPDSRQLASLGDEIIVWNLGKLGLLQRRVAFRAQGDRVSGAIRFFADGRLLALREGIAQVFHNGRLCQSFRVPVRFETPWCLSHDERFLNVAIHQGVVRTNLSSGETKAYQAPIARPETMPPVDLAQKAGIRTGCALWRTEQGLFLHQSDGPRGWVEPLALSRVAEVLLPTEAGAAIVNLNSPPSLVGTVTFEGKLRASRVLDHCVVMVNEKGRVFQSRRTSDP